jgi:uncharacterized protein YciI
MTTFLGELIGFQAELCTPELLKAHAQHLETLHHQKKLFFCGLCEDGSAFFLLSVESKQKALNLVNQDPLIIHSIYKLGSIKAIRLATPENGFLLKE